MAKKHKTTDAEKDQMLETPAGTAVASEAPVRLDWPESTEEREVNVTLTDAERIQVGLDHIKQIGVTTALVASKKSASKEYAIKIDDSKSKEAEISEAYQTGRARRKVTCRTLWQTNGYDAAGNPIYHSEMKTLVREDNGEVVEIKPITMEDRLFAPTSATAEEMLEKNQKAIMAADYTLEETPDDSKLESPFVLIAPDGAETPIDADSLAEAAAKAVALLPVAAQPDEEEAHVQAHSTEEPEFTE